MVKYTVKDKLGFIGALAQIQAVVLLRFFKSGRPRGVSASWHFLFAKFFLLCLWFQKKKRLTNLVSKAV